jgi:hypothetical protein
MTSITEDRKQLINDVTQHLWTPTMEQTEKFVLPTQRFSESELAEVCRKVVSKKLWAKGRWSVLDYSATGPACFKRFAEMQRAIVDIAKSSFPNKTPECKPLEFISDGNKGQTNRDASPAAGRPDGGIIHHSRNKLFNKDSTSTSTSTQYNHCAYYRSDHFKLKRNSDDIDDVRPTFLLPSSPSYRLARICSSRSGISSKSWPRISRVAVYLVSRLRSANCKYGFIVAHLL